jgi:hypothetical protein
MNIVIFSPIKFGILWKKYILIETMETNKSFQTQSNVIHNEKEETKANLQKLHLQKEKWRGHGRNCVGHFSL